MIRVTVSEVRCFLACPQKHHLKYTLRRRPLQVSSALTLGTMVHKQLEAMWGGTAPEPLPCVTFEAAKAHAMLGGYEERWAKQTGTAERVFEVPLVNPKTGRKSRKYVIAGKVDVDCEDSIVEHKTTSHDISPGSDYWGLLNGDIQVCVYMHAMGKTRCVYDVLKVPQLRPLQVNSRREIAETPEEYYIRCCTDIQDKPDQYYARANIVMLEADRDRVLADVWATARLIDSGWHPRNVGVTTCMQYGRCEYFDVCNGCASIDDDALYRTADTEHEELGK
jgi:hypothetical protein